MKNKMTVKKVNTALALLLSATILGACGASGDSDNHELPDAFEPEYNIVDAASNNSIGAGTDYNFEEGLDYNPDEDLYYSIDDGIAVYCLATKPEAYIEQGFSKREAEQLFYRDEIIKSYPGMDCFYVDLSDDSTIISKEMSGDELISFSVEGPDGRELKFEAKNIRLSDSGEMIFAPESELTLLSQLDGIAYIAPCATKNGAENGCDNFLIFSFGASAGKAQEVSASDELLYLQEMMTPIAEGYNVVENYSGFGFFRISGDSYNSGEITVGSIAIRYSGIRHDINRIYLDTDFYGYLAAGDFYDPGREIFSIDEQIFKFYMVFESDTASNMLDTSTYSAFGTEDFEVGDLYDADGNVKDKSQKLEVGDYLIVNVKGSPCRVELPIYELFNPENLYESMVAGNVPDEQDINVLVVPYCFADQQAQLDEDMEQLLSLLGRVADADGNITEYASDGEYFTLSDYYEKASYGKLRLTSYVTDWYSFDDKSFEYYKDSILDEQDIADIQEWINTCYFDNMSSFDQNADGILDAVILVCASSGEPDYLVISNSGAVNITNDYNYDNALSDGGAALSHYVVINESRCCLGDRKSANVMIHEFGHQIGLIDYYDVFYSGVDAVGGYDMQSQNVGDWNPFSKFAAGWIEPTVLTPEAIGDGITITVSSFAQSGDTVIIPSQNAAYNSDGSLNPFNEYIMIDLFTPDGVNEFDAADYGLNKTGIRMYHVDSRLLGINIDTLDGRGMTVGDYLFNNSYSESGKYCIELLQKSGNNTMTDIDMCGTMFCNEDLFYSGDFFSMNKHKAFFVDGKMDDGTEFPYTITVENINDNEATIRISK